MTLQSLIIWHLPLILWMREHSLSNKGCCLFHNRWCVNDTISPAKRNAPIIKGSGHTHIEEG